MDRIDWSVLWDEKKESHWQVGSWVHNLSLPGSFGSDPGKVKMEGADLNWRLPDSESGALTVTPPG